MFEKKIQCNQSRSVTVRLNTEFMLHKYSIARLISFNL